MIFMILYCAIEIPADFIFGFENPYIVHFNVFMNILFILDLIINIYRNRNWKVREQRAYYYFWFWIDFLSATPFEILALVYPSAYELHFLSFFKVLRIVRIIQVLSTLRNLGNIKPSQITYQRLLNFVLISTLGAHWIALAWIFVRSELKTETPLSTYINALYWTITTLTTIGYGDITPQNDFQKVFTMLVMVTGVGFYGYIIGNFTSMLAQTDYVKMNFLEKMDRINTFLKYKKVPKDLTESIYDYYKFLWENRQGIEGNQILDELPYSLKMKVAMFLNKDTFSKISIFKDAPQEIISEIVLQLKPEIYIPGDFIFREGETGDKMYFISFGSVEILSERLNKTYAVLNEGGYFGEFALLFADARTASAKALTFCDLYSLDRGTFQKTIQKHPEFHKRVMEIAQERLSQTKSTAGFDSKSEKLNLNPKKKKRKTNGNS